MTITPTQTIQLPQDPQQSNSAIVTITASTSNTVIIHALQTLLIAAEFVDLTGTKVIFNYPLTVIGGHDCTTVPVSYLDCDPIATQLPPTINWGTQFLLIPNVTKSIVMPITIIDGTKIQPSIIRDTVTAATEGTFTRPWTLISTPVTKNSMIILTSVNNLQSETNSSIITVGSNIGLATVLLLSIIVFTVVSLFSYKVGVRRGKRQGNDGYERMDDRPEGYVNYVYEDIDINLYNPPNDPNVPNPPNNQILPNPPNNQILPNPPNNQILPNSTNNQNLPNSTNIQILHNPPNDHISPNDQIVYPSQDINSILEPVYQNVEHTPIDYTLPNQHHSVSSTEQEQQRMALQTFPFVPSNDDSQVNIPMNVINQGASYPDPNPESSLLELPIDQDTLSRTSMDTEPNSISSRRSCTIM